MIFYFHTFCCSTHFLCKVELDWAMFIQVKCELCEDVLQRFRIPRLLAFMTTKIGLLVCLFQSTFFLQPTFKSGKQWLEKFCSKLTKTTFERPQKVEKWTKIKYGNSEMIKFVISLHVFCFPFHLCVVHININDPWNVAAFIVILISFEIFFYLIKLPLLMIR